MVEYYSRRRKLEDKFEREMVNHPLFDTNLNYL